MLKTKKLEKPFWAEAMTNVIYILNQWSIKALRSVIPKQACNMSRPCVVYLCVFGSIAYAMVSNEMTGKLNTN